MGNFSNSTHIYRFRDKCNGIQDWKFSQCTTIKQNEKEVKLERKNDMFHAIYSGWMLDRKSCSNCLFSQINRVADITLADFWGLPVPNYYKQGVSLIIANNTKANSLIQTADTVYTFEASLHTALNGNPHLFTGYKFIQFHPIVIWPNFFKKILSQELRFNILTNKLPYKLFWAFYKLATICLIKIRRWQTINRLQEETPELLKKVNYENIKWPNNALQ